MISPPFYFGPREIALARHLMGHFALCPFLQIKTEATHPKLYTWIGKPPFAVSSVTNVTKHYMSNIEI